MTETNRTVEDIEIEDVQDKTKGKIPYDIAALAEREPEMVKDGLLTGPPSDFDRKAHKGLRKENFVTEVAYIRYQSLVAKQRSESEAERSKELLARAERLEQFGDEATRKAADKLAKAAKQAAELRRTLLESGITEEQLEAMLKNM